MTGPEREASAAGSLPPVSTEVGDLFAALRSTELKFSTVFRACPDIITITVRATGAYLDVNDTFERLLGFSRAEVLGHTSFELGIWAFIDDRNRMLAELSKGRHLNDFEVSFRRKNGEIFPSSLSSESVEINGQDCVIIIARDISEWKRKEAALHQALEDLGRTNIELERFAHIAAHDLKEPCRTICSYAQIVERRYGKLLDDDGREFLGFLVSGARRMQALVEGLLAYSRSRTSAQPFSSVPMEGVIADVLADLHEAIQARAARITIAPNLPIVHGDRAQIHQLLLNLVGNALKFQPAGQVPEITFQWDEDDTFWTFRLSDNGIGIPAEQHDQVFAVFHRLHGSDQFPGTGIGLAVAKRIVESHGGFIAVEQAAEGQTTEGLATEGLATEGRGTTLLFGLPKSLEPQLSHF